MFRTTILPLLARTIIRMLSATLRIRIVHDDYVPRLHQQGTTVIFAFWHGRQFPLVFSHRNRGICIMTSLSKDGDLQTSILKGFGYHVVRGSSSRGGGRAAIEMIRSIEQGHDVAFAVDGPHGPVYQAKPGVAFLAQRTGRVIIPVATACSRCWVLSKAWDAYQLPKPFSRALVRYGDPITVAKDDNLDVKTRELDEALNTLTAQTDAEIFQSEKSCA